MSTMYSWPRAMAALAMVSIDAPPSDHVEWVWQSPLRAARTASPSPISTAVVSSSFLRYSGT